MSQTPWCQISAKDRSRANVQGPPPARSRAGLSRHSLFTGAQGRLVLHLVQLVHFMLLPREPNKTRDTERLAKTQSVVQR